MERKEVLTLLQEEIKEATKRIYEKLMEEERRIYLEGNATRGNGYYTRSLLTPVGEIEELRVPRTRDGEFSPAILPYRRRASFELGEVVLHMFASGSSVRDVSNFLYSVYSAYYSPSSISRLINVAEDEIEAWRNRALAERYAVVYLDAIFLPVIRGESEKEPVYVALGVRLDGTREILGYWLCSGGESSFAWESMLDELYQRGVREVGLFVTDGLSGIREAIRRVFPASRYQRCVLHSVRYSLNMVRQRDRAEVASDLKRIYRAKSREEAERELQSFAEKWQRWYPRMVKHWQTCFEELTTFMKYPPEIRCFLYTTNAIERLNKEVRRRAKVIEIFSPKSLEKVLYLVLREENAKLRSRRLRGFSKLDAEVIFFGKGGRLP
jgi:putative transposase